MAALARMALTAVRRAPLLCGLVAAAVLVSTLQLAGRVGSGGVGSSGAGGHGPWSLRWPSLLTTTTSHVAAHADAGAMPPLPPAGCKNVVAVSMFNVPFHRDSSAEEIAAALRQTPAPSSTELLVNKYTWPMVNTVLNWRWLLPEWCVRVYVVRGHPVVRPLQRLGAEVVEVDFEPTRWVAAMTWRFLAEDDVRLERWASREADSPPTYQDATVLRAWARTGLPIHAMHLRGPHMTWNGGTWGARRGFLTEVINSTIADELARFRAKIDETRGATALFGAKYGDDQVFMSSLWPRIDMHTAGIAYVEEGVRANRTLCYFKECAAWPPYPGSPDGFLASMNSVWNNQLILCHYADAPYCRKTTYAPDEQAWRVLYELCVGRDFFTDAPLDPPRAPRLAMDACPYAKAEPLPF